VPPSKNQADEDERLIISAGIGLDRHAELFHAYVRDEDYSRARHELYLLKEHLERTCDSS
jgi:hypothetical protein